jgi:hypothetical protein
VNVDKSTWTLDVETKHSAKSVSDIQGLVPYHHYNNGEGFHFLPEVGAICMLGFPSDNTPPFIMGYKGAATAVGSTSTEGEPVRSSVDASGSQSDASFRSNRPDLMPGDIAFTTRDENFIILRRGGVVQIGATPIAQRVYIPVLNYVKDFCENYNLSTFGGDIAWTVERQESDPSGNAPGTYVFHMNEFAQDAKASVRIRHFPLQSPGGGAKTAWEVHVAAQNIDRDSGEVTDEKYSMQVLMDGTKTEFVGANRSVTVTGDDALTVSGDRVVTVSGKEEHQVSGELLLKGGPKATLTAAQIALGQGAVSPVVLGDILMTYLTSLKLPIDLTTATAGPPAVPPPPNMLSTVVKTK